MDAHVGCASFFVHWVHTIIHGVTHRGSSDPGLGAIHGRFNRVLTSFPPAVEDLIGHWGIDHPLEGTGIPPHLVQTAVERACGILWTSIPDVAFTEGCINLR